VSQAGATISLSAPAGSSAASLLLLLAVKLVQLYGGQNTEFVTIVAVCALLLQQMDMVRLVV
jgi:hypothetical protein